MSLDTVTMLRHGKVELAFTTCAMRPPLAADRC